MYFYNFITQLTSMQSFLQTDYRFIAGYVQGTFSWLKPRKGCIRLRKTQAAWDALLLSTAFFFLSAHGLFAQPAIQWDKTIGGPFGSTLFSSQQTSDGGYILGGTSSDWKGFDKTDPGNGSSDYWIVKLSANGVKQWDNAYGGPGEDNLTTMQQTADGGYILAGHSISAAGGDKSENYRGFDLEETGHEYDIWVIKVTANGTREWDKTLGGIENESVGSIIQTADGGYILSGTSASGVGFDKTSPKLGGADFWIVKLASNGEKQWDKTYGTSSAHEQNCLLKKTTDGGYILGGTTGNWPYSDYMVVQISRDGTQLWEKIFSGNGEDYLTTIQTTRDGGFLIGGYSDSNAGGDKTEGSQVSPIADYIRFSDYWVIKLEASGAKEWDKTIGGNLYDAGGYYNGQSLLTASCQTSDGGYLLGGHSTARKGRSKSEDSKGKSDFWVVKVDANGNRIWDKTIGGNENEELRSIFKTTDDGYFLAGSSYSNTSFDKTENQKGSGPNYWVVKLAPAQPPLPETSIRINAGGAAFTASGARQFSADQYYAGINRTSSIATGDILNTADDVLYRSGRCSPSFSYNIPMANGKVNVILHFAETWYGVPGRGPGGAGKRQFNVTIENSRKLTNFDIFTAAGGAMRAVQKLIPVTITDGMLNIDFTSGAADLPRVSAIEVVRTSLTLKPVADAYTRNGIYASMNYGSETTLHVKKPQTSLNQQRNTYLKFVLSTAVKVTSAKLRIYGYNHENTNKIYLHVSGLDDDSWEENTVTNESVPLAANPSLSSVGVTDVKQYYELDVSSYVKAQLAASDAVVSFMLVDPNLRNTGLVFNSRENSANPPQLILQTQPIVTSNTRLSQEEISSTPETEHESSSVYPNPVRKQFTVALSTKHSEDISLNLLNSSGHSYKTAAAGKARAGQKAEVDISGLALSSGIYMLKIKSDAFTEVIKMLVTE
jgi:hypothetical protein